MSLFGRTGRIAAIYLVLAALQRGVSLLILPFVSHAMAPSEYGAASVLTASALLIVAVFAAPLEQLVFRASARGGEDAPSLIRVSGLYCYLVLPVLSAAGAILAALYVPFLLGVPGEIWAIELLAVGFLPATTSFALPLVRARQLLGRFVCLALPSVIVTALAKVVFVVVLEWGVLGWAVSDLVSAFFSAILAYSLVRLPAGQLSAKNIRGVLNFAVPLIPHRASFWALSSLSKPAMAIVSSLAQVGLLSFGLNLAAVASLILAEINQALLPKFSRETFPAPTSETKAAVRLQLVFSLAVPAVIGSSIAIVGPWIFARPYWESFALAGLLLLGQTAYGLYLIPMNYLVQSAGQPKFSSVASVSGAVIVLAGVLIFGGHTGAVGVAYATVFGFVLMAVVAWALTRGANLDIRWRTWCAGWPAAAIGVISLGFGVGSLLVATGSPASYWLAGSGIALASAATALTVRR